MRHPGMFEWYEESSTVNDLLTLLYILEENVEKMVFTSQLDPKAIPITSLIPSRYTDILSSFQTFLHFYKELKPEGAYSEVILYYKLRHEKLSFMALHSKYTRLCESTSIEEDDTCYNEDLYRTLLECNEYVSNRSPSDIFLAPLYMSKFFKRNEEPEKSRAMMKEARRIAKISNRLDVLRRIDRDIE